MILGRRQTLLHGAVQLDGPHPIFGENQPAEAVATLAYANFPPEDRMEISFTSILANTGDRLVLFDRANAEHVPVTGYHLPFPAAGFVDKTNDGDYRWVQARYQINL